MVDNVCDFIKSVFEIKVGHGTNAMTGKVYENCKGELYCPRCCDVRKMDISLLPTDIDGKRSNLLSSVFTADSLIFKKIKSLLAPSLWIYKCTQCDTIFTVVFYQGVNDVEMAILPSCNGGVVSPNTPTSVAYYLDQAYRAKSVGANSACMAMYRGALDQLLHEQGYTKGMLGKKLGELEKDIENNNAPIWAKDLNPKYMSYLNKLGNGSIHSNDGDVEKQKELDNDLLVLVDGVFAMLLEKIYEQPKREENWLNALEVKSILLK